MVPSFLLRSYLMYSAYIVIWIPSVRLQCSSMAVLQTACNVDSIKTIHNHLADDPEPVTLTFSACPHQSGHPHTGWSLSPGGGSGSALDTSPAKYTVNGNSLTINNINGTDEGLYRCVYETGATERIACIYVYGRAVFASCPLGSSASCASSPTSLTVEDGGSVRFDATVIHTPGGSCRFRQNITNIRLKKINLEFDIEDEVLVSCSIGKSSETCSKVNSRVSLSRGNDPGYEFIFTLTGANVSDFGMYKVEVEVCHPRTGSNDEIIKMFHLNVTARSRPLTMNPVDATTATSMANIIFTDDSSSVATLSTAASLSSGKDNLSILIPIAVVVPVAIAALVLAIIGIGYVTIKITRKPKLSVEKFSEKEQSQVRTIEHDGPPIEETGYMVLQMHLNGATQNDTNTVTELPPPNNRVSLIEPDSGVFTHLDNADSQAVNV